jgi:putative transcriptional regulator
MELEWDNAKERTNRKKHGLGFRTAARVFLDPYAIEFDDFTFADEPRFNVIGVVDGRMILVTYTVRKTSFGSFPPEEQSRMKKGNITRFRLNQKKPPTTDWRRFDEMSEKDRHKAALSDADSQPATKAQLARARRVPAIRALRQKLNLTQEEFATRFHLPLGTVRDWEQGAHRPDKAAQILLMVIANDPDAVTRALANSLG